MVWIRVAASAGRSLAKRAELRMSGGDLASGWRAVAKTMDFWQFRGVLVG